MIDFFTIFFIILLLAVISLSIVFIFYKIKIYPISEKRLDDLYKTNFQEKKYVICKWCGVHIDYFLNKIYVPYYINLIDNCFVETKAKKLYDISDINNIKEEWQCEHCYEKHNKAEIIYNGKKVNLPK